MTMEKELVTGNLRMEDIINLDESKAMNLFRRWLQEERSNKLVE